MKWPKLILLGDSNTQFGYGDSGWVSGLSNLFQRKCDVVNRGFSGYSTDHIKLMLTQIFDEFDVQSTLGVIIMLGSNDSTDETSKNQHVPLERYEKNLGIIINYLLEWGMDKSKIILISPPKIFDEKWKQCCPGQAAHFNHLVREYAKTSMKFAQEKSILSLDFNQLMEDYGENYPELLFDGLHLSAKGGKLLLENLIPLVEKNLTGHLKMNFPDWKLLVPNQTQIDQ